MVRRLLIAAAALPLLAACATFQASASEITPQQTAALKATCTQVMRLREGQSEFEGCVSDLSDVLVSQIRYDRATSAYQACDKSGLKRGAVDFSRCVLDRENQLSAAGAPVTGPSSRLDAAYVKPSDDNPHDYFETSFGIRHQREQYACAELGLLPDSQAMVTCVNNLDTDLFNIEHPLG